MGGMRTCPSIALLCLLGLLVSGAEARTFTNTAGKKIEAELIGVEKEAAILKLGNGRTAKVPLNSLSEEDQTYAKSWHEENKNKLVESDVRLTIDKNSKRTNTKSSSGNKKDDRKKSSKSETSYTCTLENSSTKTIEGITASYTIYKRVSRRDKNGSNTSTKETTGTDSLDTLKPRLSVKFTTDGVTCEDSSQKSENGPSRSQRESILGFVVTLSVGGEEFLKQCHPENYLERQEEEAKRQEAREKSNR